MGEVLWCGSSKGFDGIKKQRNPLRGCSIALVGFHCGILPEVFEGNGK